MTTGVIRLKLFIDRLIEKVKEKNSHLCVGLDPHPELLPDFLINDEKKENSEKEIVQAIWRFNKEIINCVYELAVAVKPQIAFYELFGPAGIEVYRKTVDYARKKGLLIIVDAKRSDIGSTAVAYARAYLQGDFSADAITVNPYLGSDGIKPFLKWKDRGAFVLLKTSNPGSGELQDLQLNDGSAVYQKVGELINCLGDQYRGENGYSNLGAVIGATYPDELKRLRKELPRTYFLIPGFGAQGGSAQDVINGFNVDGLGALINSSRDIIFACKRGPLAEKYSEEEFGEAAREAARIARDEINRLVAQISD